MWHAPGGSGVLWEGASLAVLEGRSPEPSLNPAARVLEKNTRMSSDRPDFTVLIVSYNTREDVVALLADIERLASGAKVIVVDNASHDGTIAQIASRFPQVDVLSNAENVGFARAVNQGLRRCTTEFVFLLNPDIRLPDPDFFRRLLRTCLSSAHIGAVGPLQYQRRSDGLHLNFTWSYWSPAGLRLVLGRRLGRRVQLPASLRVPFLNAGCLLLRTSALFEIGLLNEQYFLYGEEPDLCLKLRVLGYECRLEPRAWVVHHRESSLSTLPAGARLGLKLKGMAHIADALLRGGTRLLWVWLRRARSVAWGRALDYNGPSQGPRGPASRPGRRREGG